MQIAAEDYKSKADERGDRAAELREKKFMEEQVILCCRDARMCTTPHPDDLQPSSRSVGLAAGLLALSNFANPNAAI